MFIAAPQVGQSSVNRSTRPSLTCQPASLTVTGGDLADLIYQHQISPYGVAALSDATHVIFPSGFHVQVLNLYQCATSVMLDFIADPRTHPDISCAKDSPPVTFLLELPDNRHLPESNRRKPATLTSYGV